jgi:hypothetical protein
MCGAKQSDVGGIRATALATWMAVIVFEKRTRLAAFAFLVHEGAVQPIAVEHLSPCFGGDPLGFRRTWALRARGLTKALFHELSDQEFETFLDERRQVSAGVLVCHEIESELELVPECLACRELHAMPLGGERLDGAAIGPFELELLRSGRLARRRSASACWR